MSESDSQQMEEQKAILKFFRIFSVEEQNGDTMLGDNELSFDEKKNGNKSREYVPGNRRDSLSYVILPREGETIPSAGNDSDMTEEERNHANLTEQHGKAVDTENVSEHFEVSGCSDGGCHMSPDENAALKESSQAKCQHSSTDCTNTCYDCVARVNVKHDTEGVDQRVREECENAHLQQDFVTSSGSDSVAGCDSEKSAKSTSSKAKRVVITVTRTRRGVEEYVEPMVIPPSEHNGGSSCFENDEEEGTGAKEDSDKEQRDVSPGSSTEPTHPDTSPNIFMTSAAGDNDPPPGTTFTRATFSPGSPADKQIQLPALFSGLRVLRKRVVGAEHDTVAKIKLLSPGERREANPERRGDAKVQGSVLDQISQFLGREKRGDETEEKGETKAEGDEDHAGAKSEESEEAETGELETEEEAEDLFEPTKPSVSSAEAVFDAFKAFFTPKPLRKDPADKVDLEAVRRRIRADKDALRALFERASSKTPDDPADCQVGNVSE